MLGEKAGSFICSPDPTARPLGEGELTYGLLAAIHDDSTISQRAVADRLGIALGLANAYIKRCMTKGYIKVRQIPSNRYSYYLTPRGFVEKSRLAAQYFRMSLDFFRAAREEFEKLYQHCHQQGWNRVAIWGMGDPAEIASLCMRPAALTLVGIVDPDATGDGHAGLPLVRTLAELGPVDAVILAHIEHGYRAYGALAAQLGPERVLRPRFVSIHPPVDLDDDDPALSTTASLSRDP